MTMRRSGLALGLALAAAGCSHSPPTQFYVLAPSIPASTLAEPYQGPPIRVTAVKFPPEFDRPELVDNRGSSALVVHDFAQWAAPIGALARQALTEDLVARLPPGQVLDDGALSLAHRDVEVEILALRREGRATSLVLTWTLSPERPEALPAEGAGAAVTALATEGGRPATSRAGSEMHRLRLSEASSGSGPEDQAQVVGRLLGRTADQIALTLAAADR